MEWVWGRPTPQDWRQPLRPLWDLICRCPMCRVPRAQPGRGSPTPVLRRGLRLLVELRTPSTLPAGCSPGQQSRQRWLEPVPAGPPAGPSAFVPKSSYIPHHGFGLCTLLELFCRDKAVCATSIPLPPAATRNAHCPVLGCSHMGAPGGCRKGAARLTLPGQSWHRGCKGVDLLIN